MTVTHLQNLINPQVMSDMISAGVIKNLKFAGLAKINTELKGKPGDTLSLPKYAYIGDAEDVAPGQPIPIALLTTTSTDVTIKKAGKGVEITDEAVLSGYGDPVGEAQKQEEKAIRQKVDADCFAVLIGSVLSIDVSTTSKLIPNVIADVDVLFGEDVEEKGVIFVAPTQLADLRKSADYIKASEMTANEFLIKGVVGSIFGHQIVLSNKIAKEGTEGAYTYTNYLVKKDAIEILLKRDIIVETDRDIINKTTVMTADEHYGVYLADDTKVAKIKVQA